MESEIKAIVGLGNPGPRYADTRHNAGAWFLDALARRCDAAFRPESKDQGEVAPARVGPVACRLFRPATYMNHSGQAVQAFAAYYKVAPGELLVVYDDLDLPPGVARFKSGGGHGGHNGLRDLHRHVGPDYHRLRLGIGHPGDRDEVVNYVLRRPRQDQQAAIEQAIDAALAVIDTYVAGDRQKATTALHTRLSSSPEADQPD